MMENYDMIKEEAKSEGKSVKDLLALSPNNDPFYVGSAGQMEKAQWFQKVYNLMGSPEECHVRRVHYWLVSSSVPKPDGTKYENTLNDWGFVTMAAKYARYAGLVPVERIIDRRNPPPTLNARFWQNDNPTNIKEGTDAKQIVKDIVDKFYCYNPHNTQNYLMEIWCEKSTMNDILEPICRSYGMNLVTGLGELSITAVHNLVNRVFEADKPVRIFYVSDFDPAGECMPVSVSRKIEFFIREQDSEADVKLKPIVLTADQCSNFKLPRTPIKETERRRGGFEDRHGVGATELDALEALMPGVMKKIIEQEISPYFNVDGWNKAIQLNKKIQTKVNTFLSGKVGNVLERLELKEFDDVEIEKDELVEDSDNAWLYDSQLDYRDQLDKYKEHQN
jgi:hypothetical protein